MVEEAWWKILMQFRGGAGGGTLALVHGCGTVKETSEGNAREKWAGKSAYREDWG